MNTVSVDLLGYLAEKSKVYLKAGFFLSESDVILALL